jgi:acetylornithine/succinyldiaminopimelate/putrescine aminotransferase
VAFHGGYHGDTFGALSAMSSEHYRAPFVPLLQPFEFLPFDDLDAIKNIDSTIAAVLVEPAQGEGGVRIPSDAFLPALRRRCDEIGALLILDEVMTGFGRTGKFFACEHWQVRPDILCLAKALGGGLPLGAFIGRREVMQTLSENPPLSHVTTFGGHPLSCAAGFAATEVILEQKLIERAATIGGNLLQTLRYSCSKNRHVKDVRGLGCFLAIEFDAEATTEKFVNVCRTKGLIIGWTLHHSTIVRMAPPLVISDDELVQAVKIMQRAAEELE